MFLLFCANRKEAKELRRYKEINENRLVVIPRCKLAPRFAAFAQTVQRGCPWATIPPRSFFF